MNLERLELFLKIVDCGVYAVRSFRVVSKQEAKVHQALVDRVAEQLSEARRVS